MKPIRAIHLMQRGGLSVENANGSPLEASLIRRIFIHCSFARRSNHETGTGLGRPPLQTCSIPASRGRQQFNRRGGAWCGHWKQGAAPLVPLYLLVKVKPPILCWTTNSTILSIQATNGHRMHQSALRRTPPSSTVSTTKGRHSKVDLGAVAAAHVSVC